MSAPGPARVRLGPPPPGGTVARGRPWRALFLFGVTHRSGTNHLHDLLALHPGLRSTGILGEDWLVHHASRLDHFVRGTVERWPRRDPLHADPAATAARFAAHLGRSLLDFVADPDAVLLDRPRPGGARPIAKTPSVEGIESFARYFPEEPAVLLVRDGRAVAESMHRSFGWTIEGGLRAWRAGARRIAEVVRADRDGRFALVRHEDLVADPLPVLRELLGWLDLDPSPIDPEAVRALPVRGSCETRERDGELHWRPVARGDDFRPEARWQGWSRAQRLRALHLVGPELDCFGYDPRGDVRPRSFEAVRQGFADAAGLVAEQRDAIAGSLRARGTRRREGGGP